MLENPITPTGMSYVGVFRALFAEYIYLSEYKVVKYKLFSLTLITVRYVKESTQLPLVCDKL